MSFPTTIGGRYGFEKITTSDQRQVLGAEMAFPDGRKYRYVENGGTAIGDGLLVASPAPSGDHDEDLTITTSPAVGDTTIGITFAVALMVLQQTFMQRGMCFSMKTIQPHMRCTKLNLILLEQQVAQ